MIMDTKSLLVRQRTDILSKLADLAAEGRRPEQSAQYRSRAQGLIDELVLAEKAISSILPATTQKYGHCRRPIDAVVAYLGETQTPADEDQIVQAVFSGGFRSSAPGTQLILHKSIKIHLNGTGSRKNTIKKVNELIGLSEWDDSRFLSQ